MPGFANFPTAFFDGFYAAEAWILMFLAVGALFALAHFCDERYSKGTRLKCRLWGYGLLGLISMTSISKGGPLQLNEVSAGFLMSPIAYVMGVALVGCAIAYCGGMLMRSILSNFPPEAERNDSDGIPCAGLTTKKWRS
ncbi:hypothetical protein [uncultured Tateyamaria sp.]|uniref:hypothetical protein n=1 Tax=uncultured Tateyamaria sp. TaxID=455651 RepID=UPI0026154EBF|nr:hypothetical protein [uncultured Tateyamaria sp.]